VNRPFRVLTEGRRLIDVVQIPQTHGLACVTTFFVTHPLPAVGTNDRTSLAYLLSCRLASMSPMRAMFAPMPSAPRLKMTAASVVPPG